MVNIRFFWPEDYRNGKKSFSNCNFLISDILKMDQEIIDITSISDLFSITKFGQFLLSRGQPFKHCYWQTIINNSDIEYYALPGITVFKNDLKLLYFMIPTFRKIRLDYENEYKIKITFEEPLNIKIIDESLTGDERKFISL